MYIKGWLPGQYVPGGPIHGCHCRNNYCGALIAAREELIAAVEVLKNRTLHIKRDRTNFFTKIHY
jgi:hypothetical protein